VYRLIASVGAKLIRNISLKSEELEFPGNKLKKTNSTSLL